MNRSQRLLILGGLGLVVIAVFVLVLRVAQSGNELPVVSAADPGNAQLVSRGEQLYITRCAGCHGSERAGQAGWEENPNAAPPLRAIERDNQSIFDLISNGGGKTGAMPGFGSSLSASEIWALISYLRAKE